LEKITATPKSLEQTGPQELTITWQDGHESRYPTRYLRLRCSCASCVHEWTGEVIVNDSQIPQDIHPLKIEGVGRYGINIQWSDGHKTGIYAFDRLRSFCPCDKCK
jgi:DUF971 family protein